MTLRCSLFLLLVISPRIMAHDTWVETNTNIIRTGDAIHVDLKLGNHGNEHRDFKLAGKVGLDECTLKVFGPGNQAAHDLKSELVDIGYAPKEGYWTTRFVPATPGLYLVSHTHDQVVSYAPVRSIKSAKTFFLISNSLDRVGKDHPGFDRVVGHALELVPTVNPVAPMGPGQAISVRLLFEGKPLANTKVSFIPRGQSLKEGMDEEYERVTNAAGEATFTPRSGNVYLVAAHHQEDRGGKNYESTKYSATLSVFVPELCTCCVE